MYILIFEIDTSRHLFCNIGFWILNNIQIIKFTLLLLSHKAEPFNSYNMRVLDSRSTNYIIFISIINLINITVVAIYLLEYKFFSCQKKMQLNYITRIVFDNIIICESQIYKINKIKKIFYISVMRVDLQTSDDHDR